MRLSARLFASHRDLAGRSRVEVDVPPEATVADLIDALRSSIAGLADIPTTTAVAVNRVYARPSDRLSPDDEIALIPPVAGG